MGSVRPQPWSLRFFAAALVSFALAQGLMLAGVVGPLPASWSAPLTLATVHLVTVGWLLLLMMGALHQFVPVLVSREVAVPGLVPFTWVAGVAGLAGMEAGFTLLAGVVAAPPAVTQVALVGGGSLVVTAAWAGAANLAVTLSRARPLPLPARYVAMGLLGLGLTVLYGLALALAVTGVGAWPQVLAPLVGHLELHVLLGVGGFFTLVAMGVGLKLLAMFSLAPEDRGWPGSLAFGATALGLALAVVSGLVTAYDPTPLWTTWNQVGWGLALAGAAAWVVDTSHMLAHRRRRTLELNARFGWLAVGGLGLAVLVVAVARWGIRSPDVRATAVYLALFGWLSQLGLSQLWKIVPFLTWLERYGPYMGRRPVPRVQDLVEERRGRPFFWLYPLGVCVTALGLWQGQEGWLRLGSLLTLVATVGMGVELVRLRVRPGQETVVVHAPTLRKAPTGAGDGTA